MIWLISNGSILLDPQSLVASLFTMTAILLIKYETSANILQKATFMGRISYAFYLLHMPIAILMHKYFPWQGTVFSFSLGLLIWLCITVLLSAFLELIIQPKIKHYCLE